MLKSGAKRLNSTHTGKFVCWRRDWVSSVIIRTGHAINAQRFCRNHSYFHTAKKIKLSGLVTQCVITLTTWGRHCSGYPSFHALEGVKSTHIQLRPFTMWLKCVHNHHRNPNFFPSGATPHSSLGGLVVEVSRSHSDTPHSVGLLWTRDLHVSENSTWRQTTFTSDRQPRPRREPNPQS